MGVIGVLGDFVVDDAPEVVVAGVDVLALTTVCSVPKTAGGIYIRGIPVGLTSLDAALVVLVEEGVTVAALRVLGDFVVDDAPEVEVPVAIVGAPDPTIVEDEDDVAINVGVFLLRALI